MKNEILSFLKETKESIIEDYLQDNCQKVVQYEYYGDTEISYREWRRGDYEEAEDYAEQIIKEAFDEFFEAKNVDIASVIEGAKKVFDKI